MTQTDTERRLAVAEEQLTELRIETAKLNIMVQLLLRQAGSGDLDEMERAVGVVQQSRPRSSRSAHLRLVDDAGVDGQFLDEGLRRVRAARGESR